MTEQDRRTLLDCAETIVALTAALSFWETRLGQGQVCGIRDTKAYAALAQQAQPYLEVIGGQAQDPTTGDNVFLALRKLVDIVANPYLPQ